MDLIQEQARRNTEADATWSLYAPHRERVTRLLLDARAPTGERLCLLGAGNLNDLDLAALSTAFHEIVLVDVDVAALRRGLSRQGFAEDARFRVVTPTDVSGVFAKLAQMENDQQVSDEAIDSCLRTLAQPHGLSEHVCYDVVASVGLLTQLIDGVIRSVGESHPRSWELVSAIRTQHLRLMLELTIPGGAAVLVTEIVSSDSCPALLSVDEGGLPELVRREVAARNFFTGTNPAALLQLLRTEISLAEQLASTRFAEPWLWQFLARTYAVYALTMRKRG
ncbi:MAG: hypothetical protein DWI21_09710 [Planctomycetota bacterium]|nr:MAG: hypothetical protein DWI21_09710 [Planctomycetota bacterium]